MKKQKTTKNKTVKLVKNGKTILTKKAGKNMIVEAPEDVTTTVS